jgi:Tol biopolymer transport system component
LDSPDILVPWSFSPDGRLAYYEVNPETGFDLWTLPLDLSGDDQPKVGKPELFLRTVADEGMPQFSPDGRWIAYRTNESGRNEIYVRPFPPGPGGKWPISDGGGLYAFWSRNGHELFYETEDGRIMVVEYSVDSNAFARGRSRRWCETQIFYPGFSNLDLAPDGKRFAVLTQPGAAGESKGNVHVTMLQNFFDELKRRLP